MNTDYQLNVTIMRPTKNRIFCPEIGRPKMLFETEAKAENFIRWNSSEIYERNGFSPCRSYYCPTCQGWHTTHVRHWRQPIADGVFAEGTVGNKPQFAVKVEQSF